MASRPTAGGYRDVERALAAARRCGPHGKAWEKWARTWESGVVVPDELTHEAALEAWGEGTRAGTAAGYAVWSARAEWVPRLAAMDADNAERCAAEANLLASAGRPAPDADVKQANLPQPSVIDLPVEAPLNPPELADTLFG